MKNSHLTFFLSETKRKKKRLWVIFIYKSSSYVWRMIIPSKGQKSLDFKSNNKTRISDSLCDWLIVLLLKTTRNYVWLVRVKPSFMKNWRQNKTLVLWSLKDRTVWVVDPLDETFPAFALTHFCDDHRWKNTRDKGCWPVKTTLIECLGAIVI